jgi:hypothetical protein
MCCILVPPDINCAEVIGDDSGSEGPVEVRAAKFRKLWRSPWSNQSSFQSFFQSSWRLGLNENRIQFTIFYLTYVQS